MTTEQTTDGRKTDGGRTDVQATYTWLYSGLATTVSETIRNPLLVKTQTALKNKKKYGEKRFSIRRMELLHHAMWHDHDIISSRDCTLRCDT